MRGIVLVSGGIDSPVAACLMGMRGMDLVLAHFDNRPFTSDAEVEKAITLMRLVEDVTGRKAKKLLVPHGRAQEEFARRCRRNMECVLCRRMMLRVAERLAEIHGAECIVTGESLGQVASQTLANMVVEERATSLPVVRPLVGFDKVEIERMAKRMGTYEVSIRPGLCCTVAPKKPSTRSRLSNVLDEEAKVEIDRLAEQAADGAAEVE